MMRIGHFVTGPFQSHATQLSETDYARVLDTVVVKCVDCVVVHKGSVLLGKRAVEPWPSWWVIGGRKRPGETDEQTAARNLQRELHLTIADLARFRWLCHYDLVWARRAQPPQDHGCHMTSDFYLFPLTDEELPQLHPNEEYEEVQWYTPGAILRALEGTFHPAVVGAMQCLSAGPIQVDL